jgi:hypothetical protein
MSQADLRQMLVDDAIRNDYVEDYGPIDLANPDMTRIVSMLLEEHHQGVWKDWSKIDFSTENMDVVAESMTADGVPYLRISAGGDWEHPLVCILYFDGRKMRGYVPKDGNTYNHKAKSAFGNNDSDDAECIRQFGQDADPKGDAVDVEPDMARIERDIDGRIEAKGSYAYTPGATVSNATVKAERQKRIEAKQDLTGPITADMVYAVISLAAGGSYVHFELRSSRRKLKVDEGERLVGVPAQLEKTIPSYSDGKEILWYSPSDCYPLQTQTLLEAAGFTKAPDNDISMYAGARTLVIRI